MADLTGLTGKCVLNMAACMTAESFLFHITDVLTKRKVTTLQVFVFGCKMLVSQIVIYFFIFLLYF